jgi:hypothetical protein
VEGLLVDSLEPMKRDRTVIVGGVAQAGERIRPGFASIGGQRLELLRANSRWTRVLFKAVAPIEVPLATPEPTLSLSFTTPEGTLSGSRRLSHVPSLLQREGL